MCDLKKKRVYKIMQNFNDRDIYRDRELSGCYLERTVEKAVLKGNIWVHIGKLQELGKYTIVTGTATRPIYEGIWNVQGRGTVLVGLELVTNWDMEQCWEDGQEPNHTGPSVMAGSLNFTLRRMKRHYRVLNHRVNYKIWLTFLETTMTRVG